MEAANAFIREVYLPEHNARFAVEPAGEGSAFTPIRGVDLDEILCVQEERQVGNDNCVSYRTLNPGLRSGGRCARISSRRGSRCTSIPTARTPSSTDHDASAATTRTGGSRTPLMFNAPLKSARRRNAVDGMDKAAGLPTQPTENKTRRSATALRKTERRAITTPTRGIETTRRACRRSGPGLEENFAGFRRNPLKRLNPRKTKAWIVFRNPLPRFRAAWLGFPRALPCFRRPWLSAPRRDRRHEG